MNPEQLSKTGTEHAHQRALFAWLNMAANYGFAAAWDLESYKSEDYVKSKYWGEAYTKVLKRAYAIPNGGERNKVVAAKMKAEGQKSGVPDIHLPIARGGYYSLYVELKKIGGKASPEQKDWHNFLRSENNCVMLCEGWVHAARCIENYTKQRETYVRKQG